jgi:TnpA family transposase
LSQSINPRVAVLQLELPKSWGNGKTVAVDGTQYDFYEQNLLAGYHFRYRKMGAVAYRHVANNYIAYFAHFIPPGVKEAIYVIDGLMKTNLSIQPDAVHSDSHGQTTTVFAFAYLLGIRLMPRIRNWKDLSPHLTSCVKRFGDYTLNTTKSPEPWLDDQPHPENDQTGCRISPFYLS